VDDEVAIVSGISVLHMFVTFPGHRQLCYIKEGFDKIAGNMKYTHNEKWDGLHIMFFTRVYFYNSFP